MKQKKLNPVRLIFILAVLLITAWIIGVSQTNVRQPAQTSKAEQEIVALLNQWNEARVKKDATAPERILADDYTSIGNGGMIVTKADVIRNIKESMLTLATNDEVKVRFYGDTAIVIRLFSFSGAAGAPDERGQAFFGSNRETIVCVKRQGRWQIAAAHSSRSPSK